MITDKTIAKLRRRCAKFWEAAGAATLTRQQEVDYWESCAESQPGLLDEIERLRGEVVELSHAIVVSDNQAAEKRITELEAALRFYGYNLRDRGARARAVLNKEPAT